MLLMMTFAVRVLLWTVIVYVMCPLPVTQAGDPLQWGPYKVGVRTEVFVDQARECAITGAPRTLVTEVWYPAAKDADEYPLNKFADFWGRSDGVAAGHMAMMAFGGSFQKINENFRNVARRKASPQEGQFPLLVFSHGNGGLRHQNTFQAEYLASHGYVVAAPDHTGNATVTVLPDRIIPYNQKTRAADRRDDRPRDVSFLISQLTKLAASPDYWLSGALIPKEVGVFGHSYGGFTTCRATELDERIKAIIPMTLAFTRMQATDDAGAAVVGDECTVPMLVVLGDVDRTVGNAGNQRSVEYFVQASGPKYLLNFKNAGHFTFTEMPQLNPDFGDGIGSERDNEGNVTLTFSDAVEDQRITNAYSVAFFDTFLKHDEDAQKFLDQDHFPKELVYRRD